MDQENISTGWVRIFRSLKSHWIWQDPVKFQWWVDILFEVNHKDKTVNIGYDIIECKRGQSIKSLQTWANEWKVSKDTVRNFLKLLEKDKMILMENVKKSTRITVCKYESYQCDLHDRRTIAVRSTNTNKNVKNEKNIKDRENIFYESIAPHVNLYGKKMCRDFYEYWTEKNASGNLLKFEMEKTWDLNKRIKRWYNNNFDSGKNKPSNSLPNAIV